MNWVFQASFLPFLLGIYNLSLAQGEKKLPSGLLSKMVFYSCIMIIAGVISLIVLSILYVINKKSLTKILQKNIDIRHIIVTALLLIIAETWLTYSYENGPVGVVFAIACMQLFVVLIAGKILFGDQIDHKIILAMIIAFLSISYASYHSEELKK